MQLHTQPEAIDALLPQTQCTKCGFASCRLYAEAVARGTADINRCPPGGDEGVARLAELLGCAPKALDPEVGHARARAVAWIDERRCIGCTLCLRACPVDAIVGAHRFMHTVLAAQCTGCELCLPPCPVDCIETRVFPSHRAGWSGADALAAKARYEARKARLTHAPSQRERTAKEAGGQRQRRAVIAAALERSRRKRALLGRTPSS